MTSIGSLMSLRDELLSELHHRLGVTMVHFLQYGPARSYFEVKAALDELVEAGLVDCEQGVYFRCQTST